MKKIPLLTALLLSGTALIFSGCIDIDEGETREITDMLGRTVDVPIEVNRVVGIEAGALRLLVYMEHEDKVVGVEDNEKAEGAGGKAKPYIFANPQLLDLPSIGPIHGGDPELLVVRRPDVIFWTYTDRTKADDLQVKTGIPVVALNYGDLNENRQDLYDALHLIGDVMGNPERAVEVEEFIEGRLAEMDELTKDLGPGPSCYVGGIAYRGAHGILSTEPSYSSLEFVNGNNVASSLGLEHAFIDSEQLIEWDPGVIFLDEGGSGIALDEIGEGTYDTVDAVENGKIFGLLPYNWYTTNFGTVLGNSYYIAKTLHPVELADMDPVSETDEIYAFLVGNPAYDDMAGIFGGYMELTV